MINIRDMPYLWYFNPLDFEIPNLYFSNYGTIKYVVTKFLCTFFWKHSWCYITVFKIEKWSRGFTLVTWCKEPTHWKRPWCWQRLKAGGERDKRRQDGWMSSPTQWIWVWAISGRWWCWEAWHAAVHGVTKSQTWLSDRIATRRGFKISRTFPKSPVRPQQLEGKRWPNVSRSQKVRVPTVT